MVSFGFANCNLKVCVAIFFQSSNVNYYTCNLKEGESQFSFLSSKVNYYTCNLKKDIDIKGESHMVNYYMCNLKECAVHSFHYPFIYYYTCNLKDDLLL